MNDFLLFDISALLIFLVLIFANLSRNATKGLKNKFYFLELIVSTITIIFRVTYEILLRYVEFNSTTERLISAFVYLYLIAHSFVYPLGVLYINSALGIQKMVINKASLKVVLILLVDVPILYILTDVISHSLFTVSPLAGLSFLPPIIIFDLCTIGLLTYGFVLLCKYRKKFSKRQFFYGISLFPLNIILFIIQTLFPHVQIEMFVLAVTCYLLSTTFQRPELLVDSSIGAQSSLAFEAELNRNVNAELPFKIIFMKIENSKSLNTYIGTNRLNNFLKKISQYLTQLSKSEYLHADVYYLDDFVFALPSERKTDAHISGILENLKNYFNQTFEVDGIKFNIDAKFCVLSYPNDLSDYNEIIDFSRNFYSFVSEFNVPLWYKDFLNDNYYNIKKNIEKIIKEGIENNNFKVFLQPIYSIKEKRFISAEALVRLEDERYGNIEPTIFLKYAELTNQIHVIGNFVIEEVFKFVGSQEFKDLKLDFIEINLSNGQFVENNFVRKILTLLNKYKIDSKNIRFEITENIASVNTSIVEKNIEYLKDYGFKFTLDDYGTGYSNIKKIITLPFDIVKFNKSLLSQLQNEQMYTLIKDNVHLLKSLNKEILFEEIENEEELKYFDKKNKDYIECEYLQGYYYSKPLPISEFVKFLTI